MTNAFCLLNLCSNEKKTFQVKTLLIQKLNNHNPRFDGYDRSIEPNLSPII